MESAIVTPLLQCAHGYSTNIVRNGVTPNGKQTLPASNAYLEEQREEILGAYKELSSLRGLTRTFSVSSNTVASRMKKVCAVELS